MTRRLLLGYLGITLFVLVALEVPLGLQNQRNERRDLAMKVEHDATTIASVAENAVQQPTRAELRSVARYVYAYAQSSRSRVVITDARGSALIDTAPVVPAEASFASRPEIRSALAGTVASGTRHSNTLRTNLFYVAVPVASGGSVYGAVRVTFPTSSVEARIARYWWILAAIGAVVLAAAAVVGVAIARFVTRPLLGLEHAAAAVGEGELDVRAPVHEGPPEVRSLARAFNATVAKLGRVLRSQEEFLSDASHELRTPLTALRLRLETGDVDGALSEVERLSEMVEGLLELARADVRAVPAREVDAGAVARERVEHWRPLAEERGVQLRCEADGRAPVHAAPERLAQVLDNLLANALEVAPGGSAVTVVARGGELRVRDAGPGMSSDDRARAFDRFWHKSADGTGLGLAIVRRLVEADGGEVELAEAPGGGVEAVVRLRRA